MFSPSGEREFFVSSSVRLYPGFSALCDSTLMPSVRLEWASVRFYILVSGFCYCKVEFLESQFSHWETEAEILTGFCSGNQRLEMNC